MEDVIKSIIYNERLKEKEKLKRIVDIQNSCEEAIKYLNGEYKYCPQCKEYYRKNSFEFITRTKEENVCVYEDFINSGGNEYEKQMVTRNYIVCPKDHWLEIEDIKDLLEE